MKTNSERMCVICREKKNKFSLFIFFNNSEKVSFIFFLSAYYTHSFRIVEKDEEGKFILDEKQTAQRRGQYVCRTHECINRLSKHKKIKVEIEDLLKMLNLLKKDTKDYLKILKAMKNSQELVFGINMIFDEIEKVHFIIIAEDISERNDKRITAKAKEKNIPYVHYGRKNELGDIFNKEEINVIAVKNKKVARGLIE